jgi:hypothetical protein
MCSSSEAGSHSKLIDFVSLNSRLESNKEEEKSDAARDREIEAFKLVRGMHRNPGLSTWQQFQPE